MTSNEAENRLRENCLGQSNLSSLSLLQRNAFGSSPRTVTASGRAIDRLCGGVDQKPLSLSEPSRDISPRGLDNTHTTSPNPQ